MIKTYTRSELRKLVANTASIISSKKACHLPKKTTPHGADKGRCTPSLERDPQADAQVAKTPLHRIVTHALLQRGGIAIIGTSVGLGIAWTD